MGIVGLWFTETQHAGIVSELVAMGHVAVDVLSEAGLAGELSGCIADLAGVLRERSALGARKALEAPVFFPVLAVLPPGAGEQDVILALQVADDVLRAPVSPAELRGRLRLLLAARETSRALQNAGEGGRRSQKALDAATAGLSWRVNALNCLSEVHAVIQRFGQPREDMYAGIAALLPAAMLRPELASARILAEGREFASPKFRSGPFLLRFPLVADGPSESFLEVHYAREAAREDRPDAFTQEETALARLVAERLERTMARLGAEDALRREREFSALLMDTLPGGVVRLNKNGAVIFRNPRAEAILELDRRGLFSFPYDVPDFAAQTLDERPLRPDEHPFALVMAAGKPVFDTMFSIARPDGGRRFLSVSGAPLFAADGSVEEVVLSVIDITRQKAMERQLAHALKMESLGQLAAGIAHEINTPVQYVGGNLVFLGNVFSRLVELLDRLTAVAMEPDGAARLAGELVSGIGDEDLRFLLEETPAAIRESKEGLDRVAAIVLSMKRFAHPDADAAVPVDVGAAIEDTLAVSRSAWKYVAEVEKDIEPDLPPVAFVPSDFNQVLLNIVVNAAQAIEEKIAGKGGKGRISIRAVRRGQAVEVTIRDTGPGIPEAVRSRIFDPFFTTKEVGKGTGQGLAIAYAIMERQHAALGFDSKEGEGTTFVLTLPLSRQPRLATPSAGCS
jgi:signal transduction histidine kinase